jgi:uncharacterized protein YcbK (DUF882 family)
MNKYFKRKEFACKCGCGFTAVDAELLDVLTDIRETYGRPVKITSACRCEVHNRKEGGRPDSMHTKAMAADIQVEGYSPAKIEQYLLGKYPNKYGIAASTTFTHIDVREQAARWKYGPR